LISGAHQGFSVDKCSSYEKSDAVGGAFLDALCLSRLQNCLFKKERRRSAVCKCAFNGDVVTGIKSQRLHHDCCSQSIG